MLQKNNINYKSELKKEIDRKGATEKDDFDL
jgi:hypothetical protein